MNNRRIKKIVIKVMGYSFYFCFAFIVFLYLTFPYNKLKKIVIANLEKNLEMDVDIQDISPSYITGIELTGVKITPKKTKQDEPVYPYIIDDITIRFGLFSLITGNMKITFDADFLDGKLEGEYAQSESTEIVAEMKNLNLRRFAPLKSFLDLPVNGTWNGNINLKLPENQFIKGEGAIELAIDNAVIGDGKAELKTQNLAEGFKVPPIKIQKIDLSININRGVAEIKKLNVTSKDIDLIMEGKIYLTDPPSKTRFDTYLRFKFGDAYVKGNDTIAGLVMAMDYIPSMKNARRTDGFYGFRIIGNLGGGIDLTPAKNYVPGRSHQSPAYNSKVPPYERAKSLQRRMKRPGIGAGNRRNTESEINIGPSLDQPSSLEQPEN